MAPVSFFVFFFLITISISKAYYQTQIVHIMIIQTSIRTIKVFISNCPWCPKHELCHTSLINLPVQNVIRVISSCQGSSYIIQPCYRAPQIPQLEVETKPRPQTVKFEGHAHNTI